VIPELRNRIWSDIANSLVPLGARGMARDILLRLHRTTQQHLLRWGTMLLLMEIAADDGDIETVEANAQWLLSTRMSPQQQAYLYASLGEVLDRLGRREVARDYLHRAMVIGKEHGIWQLVRDAKGLLQETSVETPVIGVDWLQSISAELATAGTIRSEIEVTGG
jgi:hypothetical protein